jgi:tryptophanyl-tRNA synthetase
VQSDVREIPELYFYFNMLAYKGELERVATFKEKARKQPDNINAGLLTYPVLMSVDIIIHRATKVPVGQDQEQHLEMTRNFARRFNNLYGELFPEPAAYNFGEKLVRIPGLDGSGKMGKSEGERNAVYLGEDPKTITKKVKRAVTDSGPEAPNTPPTPPIQNLFTLMEAVSSPEIVQQYREAYADTSIRYGDMKQQLAEDIVNFTAPIRERIRELSEQPKRIAAIREAGAEKARQSARETVTKARELIGLAQ